LKKILLKAFFALIIITGISVAFNAFATPLNNSVALLQLEDSNTALATYDAFQQYGVFIKYGLSLVVIALFFFKDIKKLNGGNADETK
jgi:short subunit fatty acids transporter